jgi:hypothetical protein
MIPDFVSILSITEKGRFLTEVKFVISYQYPKSDLFTDIIY